MPERTTKSATFLVDGSGAPRSRRRPVRLGPPGGGVVGEPSTESLATDGQPLGSTIGRWFDGVASGVAAVLPRNP